MIINKIEIKENRIILVTGKSGEGKSDFCDELAKRKNAYLINSNSFDKTMVIDELKNILKYKKISFVDKQKKIEEALCMVNLKSSILNRNIYDLSDSEKMKVLICKILLKNPKIIILDDIIEYLDNKTRTKLFKILIKLKKYYDKTIIISSSDIDSVFEYIDDIIYIRNKKIYKYSDKFNIYEEKDENIEIVPNLIYIVDKLRKKHSTIRYKDSVNELIKEIYREIR